MEYREGVSKKPDTELLKMIYEFDQWNTEMLTAVEDELTVRNILPADISEKKQKLIEEEQTELLKGKEGGLPWLVIGWLTVFGFFGIFIGYNYAFSKQKSKYTGEEYFSYDEGSRRNGKNLFYTALILTSLSLIYKFSSLN